ncbi:MAG: hypothetical protein N2C12_07400 [Planctomycetales bacterium]
MKFIELSGSVFRDVVNEDEMPENAFEDAGIKNHSVLRINQQGDIELRRTDSWDVIGGLIGDFENRIRSATGLEWA